MANYLVFCTFDLKHASAADYQSAYADLSSIGLKKVVAGDSGDVAVVPTTSVMGVYNAVSGPAAVSLATDAVKELFEKRGFQSEIFVTAGTDWAWRAAST